MRTACLAVVALVMMAASPVPPVAETRFTDPTDRYDHGVLGDAIEYGALEFLVGGDVVSRVTLPENRVFEDIAPRFARLTDGAGLQIVVVESEASGGAQLAVYEAASGLTLTKRAATPHIGRRNRWLAPAAIADFDGDGINDIAYVETPHLAGILKIVTLRGDELVPIAEPKPGFSNHRIGQDFITGDVRTCDDTVELVLPDRAWQTLLAIRIVDGKIAHRTLPHAPDAEGIEAARRCE